MQKFVTEAFKVKIGVSPEANLSKNHMQINL